MSGSGAIGLGELLHPNERSRLALAMTVSAIGFGVVGLVAVAALGVLKVALAVGAIVLLLALVWGAVQVSRARLLGGAVRVTGESLPVVHAAFEDTCRRLGYELPIDVYVTAKADPAASFTSYLGSRIILFEGGLIASLSEPERRGQLSFLLGRFVGAMKARHSRLQIIQIIASLSSYAVFLNLFLRPYQRTVAYSGDQIGLSCCGDLHSALAATNRLMVGGELAPEVATRGVLDQAAVVKRRWLPRLAQLMSSQPHLTNRYLNLLLFAERHRPEEHAAFVAGLDPATRTRLEALSARSPHRRERRPGPLAPVLGAVLAAAVLGLVAVAVFSGSNVGGGGSDQSVEAGFVPAATVEPTVAPTEVATPTETATPADTTGPVTALMAHVPSAFRDTCSDAAGDPGAPDGAVATVSCTPTGANAPETAIYSQYDDATAMADAYQVDAAELSKGDCSSSDGEDSWTYASGGVAGRLACWSSGSSVAIAWTDDNLQILSSAWSSAETMSQLHTWWLKRSGPE